MMSHVSTSRGDSSLPRMTHVGVRSGGGAKRHASGTAAVAAARVEAFSFVQLTSAVSRSRELWHYGDLNETARSRSMLGRAVDIPAPLRGFANQSP